MSEKKLYDIAVIGAGPAGMTAAIYGARAGHSVALIEAGAPGGQMVNTFEIENYTGFETISGPELSMKMFAHAKEAGAEYVYGDIQSVVKEADGTFTLKSTMNDFYAKSVIVATGTRQRKLQIPGEEELAGRGVSWCAICDGAFYKDEEVVVIGGGNSAIEEALYLTGIAKKVNIVHRRDSLRAEKVLQERAFKNEKINFIWNAIPKMFNRTEDGKFDSLTVEDVQTKEEKVIDASGAFIYIGNDPLTQMLTGLGITNEAGNVIVNGDMATAIDGIFAAGDVIEKDLRQVVTATSDGAIAAQSAHKYIESLH